MKSEKSTFRGIARNVNGLRFRLERIDNEGNVIDYVATSAMGSLTGDLVDGDEIEVVGKINKEGLLIANKILNLKTRAYIMKSGLNKGIVIFLLPPIFAIIIGLISGSLEGFIGGLIFGCFLAVFIFIIFMVVTVFRS
jgi:hypothetical protein